MALFDMFKKQENPKSDLEKQIEADGIDHAIQRLTEVTLKKISNRSIAYQFILEELEGASMGNSISQDFVKNSGISINEYKGAMDNSMIEVDGPEGPQQFLRYIGMQLSEPLRVQVSLGVVEGIMRYFSFGKFQGTSLQNVRLKIENESAEIVAIAVNEKIIYINIESEDLYPIVMQPDSRYTHNINGRAVVFQLVEATTKKNIEVFLAVGDDNNNLQGLLNESFSLLAERFPNLVSYNNEYQISVYDEEDSRVMKKDGEMGVFFYDNLKIAYILGRNEYEKMPYRTYLSKYTDFDEYENNLMNSYFGND
jgi:hypothetical protein